MSQFPHYLLTTSVTRFDKVSNVYTKNQCGISQRYVAFLMYVTSNQIDFTHSSYVCQRPLCNRYIIGKQYSEQIGLLDRISFLLPFPSIIYTQDEVSLFQSRQVALHHPPLAEYTALTHINAFIINTSSGPVHRPAYQMLKKIVQSNLNRPGGNFHNHVPISSTVNNGNAKGHCVLG